MTSTTTIAPTQRSTGAPSRGRAWVLWVPGLAVALGACAATAHGLYEVAAGAGVPTVLAWLYPVMTDGLALVAYVSTARLRRGDCAYAWCVVVLAAGLSGLAQASYLAGGVGDVSTELRFGVGAWPAIAAAIVAHLLFLIAHADTRHATADRTTAAGAANEPARAEADDTVVGSRREVQELSSAAESETVQPHRQATVQPPVQPTRVQRAERAAVHSSVQPTVHAERQTARPKERPAQQVRPGVQRDRARLEARRFAHEHNRLPTVTELQAAAHVARGTASTALKELRDQPTRLHIVNDDQEAAQQ